MSELEVVEKPDKEREERITEVLDAASKVESYRRQGFLPTQAVSLEKMGLVFSRNKDEETFFSIPRLKETLQEITKRSPSEGEVVKVSIGGESWSISKDCLQAMASAVGEAPIWMIRARGTRKPDS